MCATGLQEVTKWANQHLTKGGYSESLVTDLASDIADGITLIRLVHAVCELNSKKQYGLVNVVIGCHFLLINCSW